MYAQIVAFILQQNAIVAGTEELPADPVAADDDDHPAGRVQLHGVLAVHATGAEGGAAGSAGAIHAGHRRDARGAGIVGVAWLAAYLGCARLQPAESEITKGNVREPACRLELVAAARVRTRACRWCTMACCSCMAWATGCRRSTRRAATCSGSTAARCRRASRRRSSAAWRSIATASTSARPTRNVIALDAKNRPAGLGHARRRHARARGRGRRCARRAQGQGHGGHDRHRRRRQAGRSADRRPRCRHRPHRLARQHHRAAGRAGRRQLERDARSTSARGASVWTTGSYDPTTGLAFFGTGNTYDTGPLLPPSDQAGRDQRRALHQLDARHRSRHREAASGTSSIIRTISGISTGRSSGQIVRTCRCGGQMRSAGRHGGQDRHLRRRRRSDRTFRVLDRPRPAEHRHRDRSRRRGRRRSTPAASRATAA